MALVMKVSVSVLPPPDRNKDDLDLIAHSVGQIVVKLLQETDEPLDCVAEISVVDAQTFGAVVESISPGTGYTNDEFMFAVGKTLVVADSSPVQSHIVLQVELVDVFLEAARNKKGGDFELFVIAHEVGHAVDYRKRPTSAPTADRTDKNWMRAWRTEHTRILVEEVAAQRFARPLATGDVLKQGAAQFSETADRCVQAIRDSKHAYREGSISERELANTAALQGWRILTQYAKERVAQRGAESAPALDMKLPGWEYVRDHELAPLVDTFDDGYPKLPAPAPEKLEHVWSLLMGLLGLSFQEVDEGVVCTVVG
jgi:hypothetical protein